MSQHFYFSRFLIITFPFSVSNCSSGPPRPMRTPVILWLLHTNFPLRFSGGDEAMGRADTSKSVNNPPFIVFILTSAFSPARNEISSDPFTVRNDVGPVGFRVYSTFTPPFTVLTVPDPS